MNDLEQLAEQKKCSLLMPYVAWKEAEVGNYEPRKLKTWEYYYIQLIENESQKYWYSEIEKLVFPKGAVEQKDINDVWILVTAREMDYPLITDEGDSKKQPGGMLGNAKKLKKIGVTVIRDSDAVSLVRGNGINGETSL